MLRDVLDPQKTNPKGATQERFLLEVLDPLAQERFVLVVRPITEAVIRLGQHGGPAKNEMFWIVLPRLLTHSVDGGDAELDRYRGEAVVHEETHLVDGSLELLISGFGLMTSA